MLLMLRDYVALTRASLRIIFTTPWPQSWHRLQFLVLFLAGAPLFAAFAQLCMALDHALYPGFKKIEVRSPLFIVGSWRTGSTFLHRTMARDSDTFASLRMIDQFFPAIIQKRAMASLRSLDERLGGHGYRALEWADGRLFPAYSRIHDMGLLKVEEDEFMLLHTLSSTALFEIFPEVKAFRRLLFFDRDTAPEQRDRAMRQYRAMIQRHLYHVGPHKHFISKNPQFSTKIKSLRAVFPSARFINLVRDPVCTLPSTASLLHHVWHRCGAVHPSEQDTALVLEQCGLFMRYSREALASLSRGAATEILFPDLVTEPDVVIKAALQELGLPLSSAMERILPVEAAQGHRHKSTHRYSLEQYGLTEQSVYEAFKDLYAIYEWPLPASVETQVA